MGAGLGYSSSMFLMRDLEADRKLFLMLDRHVKLCPSVCLPQVTSDSYEPISSSVNGSGFRPFDMVIPFAFRKGEITGESFRPFQTCTCFI